MSLQGTESLTADSSTRNLVDTTEHDNHRSFAFWWSPFGQPCGLSPSLNRVTVGPIDMNNLTCHILTSPNTFMLQQWPSKLGKHPWTSPSTSTSHLQEIEATLHNFPWPLSIIQRLISRQCPYWKSALPSLITYCWLCRVCYCWNLIHRTLSLPSKTYIKIRQATPSQRLGHRNQCHIKIPTELNPRKYSWISQKTTSGQYRSRTYKTHIRAAGPRQWSQWRPNLHEHNL